MDTYHSPADSSSELQIAYEQTLRYGKDLAQLYAADRAHRETLEIAVQALGAVFANSPDGLIVLDDALVIRQANPAFAALVELPLLDVGGQPLHAIFPAEPLRAALHALAHYPDAPHQFELEMRQPKYRVLYLSITRLCAGRAHGWIVTLHDRTQEKRLANQKIEFINIASHELRTPLMALMGYSDLLVDDWSDEPITAADQRTYVRALRRSSTRLKRVVDELMDFAALNSGTVGPTGTIRLKLADLLDGIAAELAHSAEDKSVALSVEVRAPDLSFTADAALLRMAVFQLTINAINFNRAGGSARIVAQTSGKRVLIRVIDTGRGIPQTDLDTIFDEFFQVEDHDTRSIDGLGLGLGIVQRAVQLLNGTVTVQSQLGVGTTVTINIPLS